MWHLAHILIYLMLNLLITSNNHKVWNRVASYMENKKPKKSTIHNCSPQLLTSSVYLGRRFMVKNDGDRKQNFTRLLTEWIFLKRYKYSEPIKYGLHLSYRLCWVGGQCLRRWTSRTKFYEALFTWKISKRYKKNTKDLSIMLFICATDFVRSVGDAWEDGRQEQNLQGFCSNDN